MYCYKCGSNIPDDSVFCMKCGIKIPVINDEELHLKSETSSSNKSLLETHLIDTAENDYFTILNDLQNILGVGKYSGEMIFMPHYSSSHDAIASSENEDIIVFKNDHLSKSITIINKNTGSYKKVNYSELKCKGKEFDSCYITGLAIEPVKFGGKFIYLTDSKYIYKWDTNTNEITIEYKVKNNSFINSIACYNEKLIYCTESLKTGKIALGTLNDISGEHKINIVHGKIWGTNIEMILPDNCESDDFIIISDGRNNFKFIEIYTGTVYGVEDFSESLRPLNKALIDIANNYKIYKIGSRDKDQPYYFSNYYITPSGGMVFVSDDYTLCIKSADGKLFELIKTLGSCVPEQFLMINPFTAVLLSLIHI